MKALVFLLVVVNLLFYAYSNGYFGRPSNPDAERVAKQVFPERLRVVSRGEPPAAKADAAAVGTPPVADAPPKAPEPVVPSEPVASDDKTADKVSEKAEPSVCLIWRQLSVADADKVSALFSSRFADFKLTRRTVASESSGWWVYIPPLPTKADVDKKALELRELGVTDFFIVQDGASRNAISLGVFRSEKGGQDRLAELKGKGVRSASMGVRPGKDDVVSLQARGPAKAKVNVIAAVGGAVPKSEAQACK